MIIAKIKRWGNSLGLVLPKKELRKMNLWENQEVIVEINRKGNPLKDLFGFGKKNKITKKDFLHTRETLEPKI